MARPKPIRESRRDLYLKDLHATATHLVEGFSTARELADARELTIMTAYNHLKALERLGCRLETKLEYGKSEFGPKVKHYRVTFVPADVFPPVLD